MRIPSHRFQEHSLHFTGSATRAPQQKSNVTLAREQAMQAIYNKANAQGVPVDYVVTQVLNNNLQNLRNFVIHSGETPLSDPTALALQATLIRAGQVATVANALDISDEDALQVIENNLQEDIDANSPAQDEAPNIAVQAALACAMDYMSKNAQAQGLPTSMDGITNSLPITASRFRKLSAKSRANNDDSSALNSDLSSLIDSGLSSSSNDSVDNSAVDSSILSPVSVSSLLAAIPGTTDANPSVAASVPSIAVSASSLPQAGTQTTAGGLLNSISSMLSSISNIANQATATSTTIGRAIQGAGANSVGQYVQQNQSSIFIIVVIIVVVIILAINARD